VEALVGSFIQDLRYAARQLRKSPGFAATAILSLTLAIGATTAIFSVVYGVLLDPYPYRDADRMVHVELRDSDGRGPTIFVSGPGSEALRALPSVDDVFLQQSRRQTLTGDHVPVSVDVGRYSPNLFAYMGVPLLLGRGFTAADAPGGSAPAVAVLSHAFWQRQFGGARDVVGRTLEIDHALYTVIGVVPPRFTWGDSDVYVPATPTADPQDYWLAFVKLKPGTRYEKAEAEIQVVVDELARLDRNYPQQRRVKVVTLNELVLGRFAGTLVLLFGAVVALLIVGCANVSILLLARGTARQHELAVRMSMGAGRGRLVRQLLTESLLLSVAGTALGVVAAYRGVHAIAAMLPLYAFPHEAAIHVNAPVLAFSAALAILTGVLFGLSPAWQLSGPAPGRLIQDNGGRHSGGAGARHVHRALIAGQVALTLLLTAGAGAAMRAFVDRLRTPLGFEPDGVVALTIAFPTGANPTWLARLNAHELVRTTLAETPGVESATISTSWFPPFGGFVAPVEVQDLPDLRDAQAVMGLVSPDEFKTLRIPLLRGRLFDQADVMRAARLAVVNRTFVEQYVKGRDPIGLRVRSAALRVEQPTLLIAGSPDAWLEIVGVVGDARNDGLDRPARPAVFLPHSFVLTPDVRLFVRTEARSELATRAIRERLRQVAPDVVVSEERTMAWWLETQGWGRERFVARLFGVFAVLALVLAATGLYSVVSYSVTQRTREVGTRMALGARRASIVGLVLGSTAPMLATGLALGLALSAALGGVLASWAGGSSRDPLTLAAAAGLLVLVALVACAVPAWRAATLDPLRALRTE
jgi:predicted permease